MGKSGEVGTEGGAMRTDWTGSGVSASAHTASAGLRINCATSTAILPTFIGTRRTIVCVQGMFGGREGDAMGFDFPPHVTAPRVFLSTLFDFGNVSQTRLSSSPVFLRPSTALLLFSNRESPPITSYRSFIDASPQHSCCASPWPVAPNQCA